MSENLLPTLGAGTFLVLIAAAIVTSPFWTWAYHMLTEWWAVQSNPKLRRLQSAKRTKALRADD